MSDNAEPFKPSIPFLKRVQSGEIRSYTDYTPTKGSFTTHTAYKTWSEHSSRDYVTPPHYPRVFCEYIAVLTKKGLSALGDAEEGAMK